MASTDQLAYVAGFIDGEGCLHVRLQNGRFSVQLSACNTVEEPVQFCNQIFEKGIIRITKTPKLGKPVWRWELNGKFLVEPLKELLPFLKVKRGQALEVLRSDWLDYRPKPVPEDEYQLRNEIYWNVKRMKHCVIQ